MTHKDSGIRFRSYDSLINELEIYLEEFEEKGCGSVCVYMSNNFSEKKKDEEEYLLTLCADESEALPGEGEEEDWGADYEEEEEGYDYFFDTIVDEEIADGEDAQVKLVSELCDSL